MIKVQKHSKEISNIIHVTSVVREYSLLHKTGVRDLSELIKNILICVPKMNKGFTGLEQHEGE